DSRQLRERFHFHNDRVKADEIRTICAVERSSLIQHSQRNLWTKWNLPINELLPQRMTVHRFEEASTQLLMHLHRGADDRVRLRIAHLLDAVEVTFAHQ